MAPQRDSLLAILVDGARPDVIARLVGAGEMPVMKRTFFDVGGFRHATSVFPSVSGPAHLPILTGAHPGRANLPGIRWAERPGRLFVLLLALNALARPYGGVIHDAAHDSRLSRSLTSRFLARREQHRAAT